MSGNTSTADIKNKQRNGNIELLRFAFSAGIVLFHCSDSFFLFKGGFLGVEFFFMLTGLFLEKTMGIENTDGQIRLTEAVKRSFKYVIKKILLFYPYFLISTFIGLCVKIALFGHAETMLRDCIGDLFFLQPFGIRTLSATGVVWYLSVSYFALFFICTMLYFNKKACKKIVFPVIVVSLTFILFYKLRGLNHPINFFMFSGIVFSSGIMRGFISICLGVLINDASKILQRYKGGISSAAFTVLEAVSYLAVFVYMKLFRSSVYDIFPFILIAVGLTVTVSEISLFSGKLNNGITSFLGKFSSVLFMNHHYLVGYQDKIAEKLGLTDYNELLMKCCCIALSFIISYVVLKLGGKASSELKALFDKKIKVK
ncbi:MAG: hypothetical protein K6C14_00390 [Eubacterium sp.]|nr:hypothetical protein [Eubacterium sp.]